MKVRLFLAVAVLAIAAPVFAQETAVPEPTTVSNVANLEQGFPAQVVDTMPTETGRWELGVTGGYVTNGEAYETALLQANYGLVENVQMYAKWPLIVGEGRVVGNGDTSLEVLGKFVEEQDMIPSMAVELIGRTPTGEGFTGYDGTIRGIASKSFGDLRAHVNAAYTTIGNNETASRNDADAFTIGVDYPLTDTVVLIVDAFSNESFVEGNDRVEMVEVGVRAAITDVDTVSFGVGTGVGNGNATPDFQAVLGYQRLI